MQSVWLCEIANAKCRRWFLRSIFSIASLACATAVGSQSSGGPFQLSGGTNTAGGGAASAGPYSLDSVFGQALVADSSNATFGLRSGSPAISGDDIFGNGFE